MLFVKKKTQKKYKKTKQNEKNRENIYFECQRSCNHSTDNLKQGCLCTNLFGSVILFKLGGVECRRWDNLLQPQMLYYLTVAVFIQHPGQCDLFFCSREERLLRGFNRTFNTVPKGQPVMHLERIYLRFTGLISFVWDREVPKTFCIFIPSAYC